LIIKSYQVVGPTDPAQRRNTNAVRFSHMQKRYPGKYAGKQSSRGLTTCTRVIGKKDAILRVSR
jgi:hypothetical protein